MGVRVRHAVWNTGRPVKRQLGESWQEKVESAGAGSGDRRQKKEDHCKFEARLIYRSSLCLKASKQASKNLLTDVS